VIVIITERSDWMYRVRVGDDVAIHSYKHDSKIHRAWQRSKVIDMQKDYVILANERTRVVESDGRMWYTREPAVVYFFKNHWFNIIGMLREDGITYYCNISSPFVWDRKVIKYIDYDLDLKVFSNGDYKILDEEEYAYHSRVKNYPEDLDQILRYELDYLIDMATNKVGPFAPGQIERDYAYYREMKKSN
jgi:protein associated with RNAse G/E